ncbi:hypothetical protein H9X96_00460 [Pedobacter sp. N36a]|nr:hypothetical protein [Pedobacter sp. N36a]MBC8984240.1 hypothetical protein [Pedobacter sp. N36a]
MPEILLICVFLIPIISLIVLFFLDDKGTKDTGYELADHFRGREKEAIN